ncbi:MAG: HAD family phosphatase [Proteobacteria bacterium]|nr:HAD family phosphatase [Pseudomonadota bacterium]
MITKDHCRAVIFDMDGLMLDTEIISQKAFLQATRDFDYEVPVEIFIQIVGRNAESSKAFLYETFGESFPYQEIVGQMHAYEEESIGRHGIPLKPGLLELLDLLERFSIPKGVGTSTRKTQACNRLQIANIKDRFDIIVGGDEVQASKPAPDLFLQVARKLGVEQANCLVLEDSEPGVKAAYAADMTPIMVPDLKQPSEDIRKLAARVFPSLHQTVELLEPLLNDIPPA